MKHLLVLYLNQLHFVFQENQEYLQKASEAGSHDHLPDRQQSAEEDDPGPQRRPDEGRLEGVEAAFSEEQDGREVEHDD